MIRPARQLSERANPAGAARILGIGTATPPSIPQSNLAECIRQICCATDQQRAWATRIFDNSGVQFRGTALLADDPAAASDPIRAVRRLIDEFYTPPTSPADFGPPTAQRMRAYARLAPPLAESAAHAAMADANLRAADITHLLTASCTGFFAPGLDVELIHRLGLSSAVRRMHLGFMGCHAAFNALGTARSIVQADPAARLLVCCVELCTLHLAYGWDPQTVIANALFADGAAAAIVSGDTSPSAGAGFQDIPTLRDTASLLLPDSRSAMTWTIGDHGFRMTLSSDIPDLIRAHLRGWLDDWLARHELSIRDIGSWAVHPGGPKVLSAVAETLDLPPSAVEASRGILAAHGNMSSATILFILKAFQKNDAPGPCVALGFGPGLMVEGLLVD